MPNTGPPCPPELAGELQRFVDAVQAFVIIAGRFAGSRPEASCATCREARCAAARVLDEAARLRRTWRRHARTTRPREPREPR